MSSHGSNGRGSVVATIGLFMVVSGSIGWAVDLSWTVPPPVGAGGALCQPEVPPMTAVISAPSAPIRRTLVSTTPPALGGPFARPIQVAPAPSQWNENLF